MSKIWERAIPSIFFAKAILVSYIRAGNKGILSLYSGESTFTHCTALARLTTLVSKLVLSPLLKSKSVATFTQMHKYADAY